MFPIDPADTGYNGNMQRPSPATESPPVPPRRHLFRPTFSLRTLLLGMALIGGGFGMFQRLDQQRQLVARIETAGGNCEYEYRDQESIEHIETWFRARLPRSYFDDVEGVHFYDNAENVDRILTHVAELKSLRWLIIQRTQVSDAGLRHLVGKQSLQWLDLSFTNVSDAGLAHLAELKSLERLNLNNTQVSDVGLRYLAPLKSLEWLDLDNTQVSDGGLKHLSGLKSLKRLFLDDTQVSAAGIRQLKTSLPGCLINGP